MRTRTDDRTVRVAVVDDHELVDLGVRQALHRHPRLLLVGSAPTVDHLLERGLAPDVVVLDLRLADGSTPVANIRRLRDAGAAVLVFTSGENPYLTRLALSGDVLGVVRKSEPFETLVRALEAAADGSPTATPEWAHAMEVAPRTRAARLSDQEARILTLFADGSRAQAVADELGITVGTLEDYVRRIRVKYARVDRPASTKVDLYKRAVEDGLLPIPSRG